ncbi:MAG TPA: T9SS type A sorting domain-containing protein, partial [Bacteroidota bacterium]|nr:T9SS type A sorting domain-containing protein [Bacteroidota bacterium]
TGTVVGTGAAILRTTTGGVTTSVNDIEIPKQFLLEQNYPNPFNPSTVIGFDMPVSGFADLRIVDLLGREVALVVDGRLSSGHHEARWTAEGLSSGVYFYRLHTGTLVETKKLVLIR